MLGNARSKSFGGRASPTVNQDRNKYNSLRIFEIHEHERMNMSTHDFASETALSSLYLGCILQLRSALEAWNGDKQWCQSCNLADLAAVHLNAPLLRMLQM